ncbi:ABC transporter substrate-binding protein [Obesumbacterium proteus]|nr:ABC transporter substrate-binding protein [Obesumbacterium proteus]
MLFKRNALLTMLLSFSSLAAASTNYPQTLDNCGHTETFTQPPTRVVTIGQHETELLLALGLQNKIVGTSVWFGSLPKEFKDSGHALNRLANNAPSFEAVVAQNPDLVLAQYSWHVGPQGEVATREQFEKLGIKTWISPADCMGKSVTERSNGDGARTTPYTLDYIKSEISDISKIFDVSDRGEKLERALASRISHAQRETEQVKTRHLKVVYWFSSSRLKGDPWVAGSNGAPGWISKTLGIQNIIDSNDEWPAVTWEHIAESKPDIIVVADMERRLYPADDVAVKLAFLKNDPVTREMPAVKEGHIIVVPAMSLNPSLRNVDAVELIGNKISTFNNQP